jgi:transcriptional regulator with XRE-family HTH domain
MLQIRSIPIGKEWFPNVGLSMNETFAQILLRLRKKAKLTQKRLAEKTHISPEEISILERDDTSKKSPTVIRYSTLEALANGLSLSEDSPERRQFFEAAAERNQQRRLRASKLESFLLGSGEILETTQRTYVESHDRTPEVRSTDVTDRSSRALELKSTHDSGILLEILRRSRENYPIRTKLHGTKIDWGDYHRKYPTVQEKISNDTWYAISDTGSFFGFMGTMIKYEYVNPDVVLDIVYIDTKLWYDNKDFTDHMRREYNEHLWEEWEYLIKLVDNRDNND